jgi:hypothetical protein
VVVLVAVLGAPLLLVYRWRLDGWERFSSRSAVVRSAAVASSRGMGFPSAVEGTSEMLDVLGWEMTGKLKKGRECRRLPFRARAVGGGCGCVWVVDGGL